MTITSPCGVAAGTVSRTVGPGPSVKATISSSWVPMAATTVPMHPGTVTEITVPGGPDVGDRTGSTGATADAGTAGGGGSAAMAVPGAASTPRLASRAPVA